MIRWLMQGGPLPTARAQLPRRQRDRRHMFLARHLSSKILVSNLARTNRLYTVFIVNPASLHILIL
jgi:hypothetical protein